MHTQRSNISSRLLIGLFVMAWTAGCMESDSAAPDSGGAPSLSEARFVIDDARMPTVALDSNSGRAYLTFFRDDAGSTDVFLLHKDAADTAWSEPVRVNSVPGDANAHGQAPAQVEIGPGGEVYVVWTNAIPIEGRRFPASNLLFARSIDGGETFSEQIAVNSDATGLPASHTFHDLAVGADGVIYVSWLDSRKRSQAEAEGSADSVQPVHLHAVEHASSDSGTEVWVATSADGGKTFSEGIVAAVNSCQCCRTSLAIAKDGAVYLAWRQIFPGGERDMAIAYSSDGGETFSRPERIHADRWSIEGCPHSGPSLAIDGSGGLHTGWYTGKENAPGLYYSAAVDGKTFASPVALVTGVGVSQIKLDGPVAGTIGMIYEDKTAGAVEFVTVSASGEHKPEAVFSMPGGSLPALAMGPAGWIVAVQKGGQTHVVQGSGV